MRGKYMLCQNNCRTKNTSLPKNQKNGQEEKYSIKLYERIKAKHQFYN